MTSTRLKKFRAPHRKDSCLKKSHCNDFLKKLDDEDDWGTFLKKWWHLRISLMFVLHFPGDLREHITLPQICCCYFGPLKKREIFFFLHKNSFFFFKARTKNSVTVVFLIRLWKQNAWKVLFFCSRFQNPFFLNF